ncbi:MAG: hypothetical protein GPOALKHO_000632 [Sodalis sp.]|nr:MAG: hypothetical protein GPOALKHO_000632 [Sodalis sp.]
MISTINMTTACGGDRPTERQLITGENSDERHGRYHQWRWSTGLSHKQAHRLLNLLGEHGADSATAFRGEDQ